MQNEFSAQPNIGFSMKKSWKLTQEVFDQLLNWLNPDREKAGKKYEEIRRRLIRIFISRGCADSEDLADETINRVAQHAAGLAVRFDGEDPALYFYGTAKRVLLEYFRKQARKAASLASFPSSPPPDDTEPEYHCLDLCIESLLPEHRKLIMKYYLFDKQAKIDYRKTLAMELNLTDNALKIKMYRLRQQLHGCIMNCLQKISK